MESDAAVAALKRFRDAVRVDPALLARLGALEIPEVFLAEAMAVARDLAIDVSEDALRSSDRLDPLGLSRFQAAPIELDCWPQTGWLPARSVPTGGAPAFDWAWFGAHALREPFYEDAVRSIGVRPLSRMLRTRTSLAGLIAGAAKEQTLAPDGFIFHMSRSGSTLVAQMLAAVPHHIVVSEAEPIDAVVQWTRSRGLSIEAQVTALRAIVAAFGRNRGGSARRFFVKLDSWHILAMPLFRAAFPDVPWLFLYREPDEVMVSQMRQPGLQFVAPGIEFDGGVLATSVIGIDSATANSRETYGAMALERLLRAAAEQWTLGGGMLVNYTELPAAMATTIPAHFGFEPDREEAAAMVEAQSRDAKAPAQAFADDRESKRAEVTPAIAAAVEAHLRWPYDKLESLKARA